MSVDLDEYEITETLNIFLRILRNVNTYTINSVNVNYGRGYIDIVFCDGFSGEKTITIECANKNKTVMEQFLDQRVSIVHDKIKSFCKKSRSIDFNDKQFLEFVYKPFFEKMKTDNEISSYNITGWVYSFTIKENLHEMKCTGSGYDPYKYK